jgi:flagellar biosynthetic protein FliO
MKAVLMKLVFLALFVSCAHGQAVSPPSRNDNGNINSSTGIATNQPQTTPMSEMPDTGMHFSVFRTLGGMGIVLCLMIGAYYAARKFAPQYFLKKPSEKNLQVIETLSMGDRRSISLIEVAGNRFLIGNTPHQINLLAALPEPISLVSEPEAISANPKENVKSESNSAFRSLFETAKRGRVQHMTNPLPEDIRTKMRQLHAALER